MNNLPTPVKTPADILPVIDSERVFIVVDDGDITNRANISIQELMRALDMRTRLERAAHNIPATAAGVGLAKAKKEAARESDSIIADLLDEIGRAGAWLTLKTEVRKIEYEDHSGEGYGPKPVSTITVCGRARTAS